MYRNRITHLLLKVLDYIVSIGILLFELSNYQAVEQFVFISISDTIHGNTRFFHILLNTHLVFLSLPLMFQVLSIILIVSISQTWHLLFLIHYWSFPQFSFFFLLTFWQGLTMSTCLSWNYMWSRLASNSLSPACFHLCSLAIEDVHHCTWLIPHFLSSGTIEVHYSWGWLYCAVHWWCWEIQYEI